MINTQITIKEKVLEIGGKRTQIPVHLQDYHLYILTKMFNQGKNIYVTPKVDGVLTNFEYSGMLFECEKLDSNLFLIDVLNNVKYQSVYLKFKMLEKIFKTQMLHQIKDINEINKILSTQDKYLNLGHTSLVVKPVFVLNVNNINKNEFTNIIHHLTNFEYLYKTDGCIIYADNFQTTKIKPLKHMTIDVEYNSSSDIFSSADKFVLKNVYTDELLESGIYRCNFKTDLKKWIVNEKRNDKIRGNKLGTILTIFEEIINLKNNFEPQTLNLQPYYFDNIDKHEYNKKIETHKFRKELINTVLNFILNTEVNSVLDIGCGNGSLYYNILKSNNSNIFYTGIDIDPFILSKTPLGGKYIWNDINNLDLNKLTTPMSHIINTGYSLYTVATFIHSLHFCKDIPKLLKTLKNFVEIIIIVGIFEDNFENNFENNDVKVIKQTNGFYDFYYKWKDSKITDKLLNISMFENLEDWYISEKMLEHNENKFFNMHNILILKKKEEILYL